MLDKWPLLYPEQEETHSEPIHYNTHISTFQRAFIGKHLNGLMFNFFSQATQRLSCQNGFDQIIFPEAGN